MHSDLMASVCVYHLRFEVEAREWLSFGAQPGSALRGALYQALSAQFCSESGGAHTPDHQDRCPVCWLLATEDAKATRGHNLPRPLTIEPPDANVDVPTGERLQFGISLIGSRAEQTFPYVVRAIEQMGSNGVGRGRGRFLIHAIESVNPLSQAHKQLLKEGVVKHPKLEVNAAQVGEAIRTQPQNRVILRFITPLRVGEGGKLARRPALGILLRRLLERCQAVAQFFGDTNAHTNEPERWRETQLHLGALGDAARLVEDNTRWIDVWSGSRRRGTTSPIGGLVGEAHWAGDLVDALPWLLWGQSLHVGKSTVKGNGWYEVVRG